MKMGNTVNKVLYTKKTISAKVIRNYKQIEDTERKRNVDVPTARSYEKHLRAIQMPFNDDNAQYVRHRILLSVKHHTIVEYRVFVY